MQSILRKYLLLSLVLLSATKGYSVSDKVFKDTIHLSNNSEFIGFSLLDSNALKADVFINGENHSYLSSNKKLWVKMIKYLYHNAGVRNVVLEYGYSAGYLINRYIQTGDSGLFEVLKKYSFEQHASAYKDLMEFNRSLPEDDKIYIAGIDLERGFRTAVKALCILLPDSFVLDDSIGMHIESLQGLCTYNDNVVYNSDKQTYRDEYSTRNTMNRFISNFEKHPEKYRELLKDNFNDFQKITMGLKDLHLWYKLGEEDAVQEYVYREIYLFNRFREEKNTHGGKFFGQFGRCHSGLSIQEETSCNWFYYRSLANRIKNWHIDDRPLKVFTTGILYKNDKYDIKGWEGVEEIVDTIFNKMDKNRVAFYYFKSNPVLDEKLSPLFDLILLNTYGQDKNYPGVVPSPINFPYDTLAQRQYLQFNVGEQRYDLNGLKGIIELNNYSKVTTLGISSHTAIDGTGVNINYYSVISQNQKYSDSLSVKLSGYGISSNVSFSIFKNKRFIDLEPHIGYGFARLKLQFSEKFTDKTQIDTRLVKSVSDYKNPALILDIGSTLRFNVKLLSFGVFGGYQWDASDSKWKAGEDFIEGLETALSGGYLRYFIGLNF